MTLKKTPIIGFVIIIIIIFLFFLIHGNKKINLPEYDDISFIEICSSTNEIIEEPEEIVKVLNELSRAKLTFEDSVNEVPYVSEYITIIMNMESKEK
ncbi:MAG: DUF5301 domain-containing protein [Lachnospirales bacterium]